MNEADLHARHLWLVNQSEFRERMKTDPDFYDVKIAGWWVWGICQWIGSGWCAAGKPSRQRPHLGDAGKGVHRKRPHLGNAGMGVHRQHDGLVPWFEALQDRLCKVRVCCGDWKRVLGPSPTVKLGTTGVFLDPPYGHGVRNDSLYAEDNDVAAAVAAWCRTNQDVHGLRIALCGYEGEHDLPGWTCVPWKAMGGYGVQGNNQARANSGLERIWFNRQYTDFGLFDDTNRSGH